MDNAIIRTYTRTLYAAALDYANDTFDTQAKNYGLGIIDQVVLKTGPGFIVTIDDILKPPLSRILWLGAFYQLRVCPTGGYEDIYQRGMQGEWLRCHY